MIFLFGGWGSRGSGLTCGQKRQIPGKFPHNFPGNFPGFSRVISLGFFKGKMIECAYRFNAPHAMMMVRTATPVLHDVRTRCLAPCHGRQPEPVESGGTLRSRGGRESERGESTRRMVADLKLPHMVGWSYAMPGRGII